VAAAIANRIIIGSRYLNQSDINNLYNVNPFIGYLRSIKIYNENQTIPLEATNSS